ncbi:hypothetical protein SECTIM467_117 [Brevibacillus phage SecTim467]|uniref:Uncharacterized protein n=2 Tax=Jenstvirus jenst TaxID=1982225 RepID=A0A0K2CPL7_9CAUD|nr:hypothetical protein AVV11_gp079 [Brevibacillus phage Jenst]ALA07241.1 hypothetical protein JENST_112 [Brevibacillus phage Jenst]ALA07565.1 hypothetical protein SECTIM467_117 [Brevibacillus phage SecTim467]
MTYEVGQVIKAKEDIKAGHTVLVPKGAVGKITGFISAPNRMQRAYFIVTFDGEERHIADDHMDITFDIVESDVEDEGEEE